MTSGSLISNLNSIVLAFVGFLILILVFLILNIFVKRFQMIRKLKVRLSRMIFFSLIHKTLLDTSIPILVPIIISVFKGEGWFPIVICVFFMFYPFLTYLYVKLNKHRIDSGDEDFI